MEIPVLNGGYVALEQYAGFGDLGVVNSARVSYQKQHEKIEEGDEQLINYLMKNKHGTPFEGNFFRFRIKAPIFVFREWHRHRIGISINEWSARYTELEPSYYVPTLENIRKQVGRPGHYTHETMDPEEAESVQAIIHQQSLLCFDTYKLLLECGVAKELARVILPVNTYSEMIWCCNARSLMHFLALRNHERAQREIQLYAYQLEALFRHEMPITAKAFVDNGRIAP